MKIAEVTFEPGGVRALGRRGDTLLDIALDQGVPLEHECGGNCSCTTCRVVVRSGEMNLSPMEPPERERLEMEGASGPGVRLACQALARGGPVVVWIPEAALPTTTGGAETGEDR